jgi:hypothetical protein
VKPVIEVEKLAKTDLLAFSTHPLTKLPHHRQLTTGTDNFLYIAQMENNLSGLTGFN